MYVKEIAIGGIVVLEIIALLNGINGTVLTLVVAIIAGIAGYEFKLYRNKGNEEEDYILPDELME